MVIPKGWLFVLNGGEYGAEKVTDSVEDLNMGGRRVSSGNGCARLVDFLEVEGGLEDASCAVHDRVVLRAGREERGSAFDSSDERGEFVFEGLGFKEGFLEDLSKGLSVKSSFLNTLSEGRVFVAFSLHVFNLFFGGGGERLSQVFQEQNEFVLRRQNDVVRGGASRRGRRARKKG